MHLSASKPSGAGEIPNHAPFIEMQRLFRLTGPWSEWQDWLQPDRFRVRRRRDDEGELVWEHEEDERYRHAWDEVADRAKFLRDPTFADCA